MQTKYTHIFLQFIYLHLQLIHVCQHTNVQVLYHYNTIILILYKYIVEMSKSYYSRFYKFNELTCSLTRMSPARKHPTSLSVMSLLQSTSCRPAIGNIALPDLDEIPTLRSPESLLKSLSSRVLSSVKPYTLNVINNFINQFQIQLG